MGRGGLNLGGEILLGWVADTKYLRYRISMDKQNRDQNILLRVSREEKSGIAKAAREDGKSVSALLRDLALARLARINKKKAASA